MDGFDFQEVLTRAVKYLVQGLAIAVAAYYIPKGRRLGFEEIAMLSVCAAATFAILDMYVPNVGDAARVGAGFGIGGNLVGFPQ